MSPHPLSAAIARREFVALAAGAAVAVGNAQGAQSRPAGTSAGVQPCLFSKPLQHYPVAELPRLVKPMGITALDLTCRAGGHVRPEQVADQLPAACEALARGGLSVAMLTTEITDAADPHARPILKAARAAGIRHLKLGYAAYGDLRRINQRLAELKEQFRRIADLCGQYGVQAGIHNHCGERFGAAMWDTWQVIEGLPAESVCAYFDARHATVEGGDGGWKLGLNLLAPRIGMLAVKDFVWAKGDKGRYLSQNVPLGQGMVQHEEVLRRMAEARFSGPISLHVEHVPADVTPGSPDDVKTLQAISADWATMIALLRKTELRRSN